VDISIRARWIVGVPWLVVGSIWPAAYVFRAVPTRAGFVEQIDVDI